MSCAHTFFSWSAPCSPCNACKTCQKCQKWLFFKVFDVLGHFKGVRKPIFRAQMKHKDHMNCAHKFFSQSASCSPCNACKTCQKWLFFNVFDVLGHFKGVRKPIFRAQMKHKDHMNCAHKFFSQSAPCSPCNACKTCQKCQ